MTTYFGSDIDFQTAEVLAIAHIGRKILADEARLYRHKWFDYRMLHPTQATYLLVHHYNAAYGMFMATCKDMGKRGMPGFKGKDFLAGREKQSFWKLRQKIDELGIRYDFFCREAMNWCMASGWRQPPRPAHISSNADMIVHIQNLWAAECRAKIQFATSPRYCVEAFCGAPDQLAYEEHIIAAIMQKPHPKYALHAALYIHDALRIEAAIAKLPADAIDAALEMSPF